MSKSRGHNTMRACIKQGMRLGEDGRLILPSGRAFSGKHINRTGYRIVHLPHNGKAGKHVCMNLARAICWLSHGPPPSAHHEVDHIDRDKLNDAPSNLRWVTHSENQKNFSPNDARCKLRAADVLKIRALVGSKTQRELAEMFGAAQSTISVILSRKRWSHI